MAPRITLTYHHKAHIVRQFSGQSPTNIRDFANRYGVTKSALNAILEAGRSNPTSSSKTLDFEATCGVKDPVGIKPDSSLKDDKRSSFARPLNAIPECGRSNPSSQAERKASCRRKNPVDIERDSSLKKDKHSSFASPLNAIPECGRSNPSFQAERKASCRRKNPVDTEPDSSLKEDKRSSFARAFNAILESGRSNPSSQAERKASCRRKDAVDTERELSLKVKRLSLARGKPVHSNSEKGHKELKKEEEVGIPAAHGNKKQGKGKNVSCPVPLRDSFHGLSNQQLSNALMTLQQVVDNSSRLPRWFTFIFDTIMPVSNPKVNPWQQLQGEHSSAILPPRQDVMSAILVLSQALRSKPNLPSWFAFALNRVLNKYKSRVRQVPQRPKV